jgi:hypothetical protein
MADYEVRRIQRVKLLQNKAVVRKVSRRNFFEKKLAKYLYLG